MNISSNNNVFSNPVQTFNKSNKTPNVSFGAIYVEKGIDLGMTAESRFPPRFSRRDELLLNEIAQLYPNQDCFIRKGYCCFPWLEFRERPASVQVFKASPGEKFKTEINSLDEEFPCVELLLHKDDEVANRIIGMQNYIATNPSLAFTISAGFEVHKKFIQMKNEITKYFGSGDEVNLGKKDINQRALDAIKDTELAVKRYLMESAFAALKDKASAEQIYASNLPKVQTRLEANRNLDLTTSVANRDRVIDEELLKDRIDICEVALSTYPDADENKQRIKELEEYMISNTLFFT